MFPIFPRFRKNTVSKGGKCRDSPDSPQHFYSRLPGFILLGLGAKKLPGKFRNPRGFKKFKSTDEETLNENC